MSLAGKTILMSGGSRGIGLAIALRAAADGANIALIAKTDTPHPKLEGTIHTAAEAIRAAGGVVEHVGMPVDPGNLLVLGRLGAVPVIGAPGCARSPKENGFDWVLARIFAGEKPGPQEITGMGVGGLLTEIPSRPQPRDVRAAERSLSIAALVLATCAARLHLLTPAIYHGCNITPHLVILKYSK